MGQKKIKKEEDIRMKYTEWLNNNWEENNIFPPALEAQEGINFLAKYLLGEDWYIASPLPNEQANTVIVSEILNKYSKRYRKELKERD